MGTRSLLFERWDRSRRLSAVLACVIALTGVAIGLAIDAYVLAAPSVSAPLSISAELRLARSDRPGLRVLFIGNSFTDANSMIEMVSRLSSRNTGAPRPIVALEYAPGGSTLQSAASDPQLFRLLMGAHWNVVVLQEQSQLPELPYWLTNSTLPAVAKLKTLITRDGAVPLLFETWGYRNGDLYNTPDDNYTAMQNRLHQGYGYVGRSQGIDIAPVGDAWALALREQPSLPLWGGDGHHPSVEGSYLTAAVISDTLAHLLPTQGDTTPTGSYTAGLDPTSAAWLRDIAQSSLRAR
jgi:hypothetical protein